MTALLWNSGLGHTAYAAVAIAGVAERARLSIRAHF